MVPPSLPELDRMADRLIGALRENDPDQEATLIGRAAVTAMLTWYSVSAYGTLAIIIRERVAAALIASGAA